MVAFIFSCILLFGVAKLSSGSSAIDKASPNDRMGRLRNDAVERAIEDNQCYICARTGFPFTPEIHPVSIYPDVTCGNFQEVQLAGIESDSAECETYQNLLEHRCCDYSFFPDAYECSSNVRSSILNDSYDSFVAPVHAYEANGTKRILEVQTLITFVAVKNLDVKTSTLEVFLDVTLMWNDPRLAWDIDLTNCAPSVSARASLSLQETEIWVPSLDLSNRASSLQDLPVSSAMVSYDGKVIWSRPGALTAVCTFVGLSRMPFDDIGCKLFFAGSGSESTTVDYILIPMENEEQSGLK